MRNYKKKSNNQKWTEEDMRMAIKDIKSKKCSIYKNTKNNTPMASSYNTYLKPGEKIVETCKIFAEWGFGLTKPDIINAITDYLHATKKPNPFKKVYLVMIGGNASNQNPELVKRKPQALQMVRAKAAVPERVNHWFRKCLKPTLETLVYMTSHTASLM